MENEVETIAVDFPVTEEVTETTEATEEVAE